MNHLSCENHALPHLCGSFHICINGKLPYFFLKAKISSQKRFLNSLASLKKTSADSFGKQLQIENRGHILMHLQSCSTGKETCCSIFLLWLPPAVNFSFEICWFGHLAIQCASESCWFPLSACDSFG